MTKKERRHPIDTAVAAFMGQTLPSQPNNSRGETNETKSTEKERRSTLTLDLPREMITSLKNLAANHDTTCSQVVALLLAIGLKAVVENKIDISDFKTFSRSPRYDWKVRLPKIPRITSKKPEKISQPQSDDEPIDIEISVGTSVGASDAPSGGASAYAKG